MKTAYVTIGNSDNKLTQQEWSTYCSKVEAACRAYGHKVFIVGFSEPSSPFQNMVIGVGVFPHNIDLIKTVLTNIAKMHYQDSIAFALVDEVEFLKP